MDRTTPLPELRRYLDDARRAAATAPNASERRYWKAQVYHLTDLILVGEGRLTLKHEDFYAPGATRLKW